MTLKFSRHHSKKKKKKHKGVTKRILLNLRKIKWSECPKVQSIQKDFLMIKGIISVTPEVSQILENIVLQASRQKHR